MATLRSVSTAKVLDLLSEGECEGLVDGLKSVYFDNTPVVNAGGSRNFERVQFAFNNGTATQDYLRGFDDVETLGQHSGQDVDDNSVEFTTSSGDVDAVRVTLRIPGLYRNTKKGIRDSEIGLKIESSYNGGANWYQEVAHTIKGRSMGQYEKSYRISKPDNASGSWMVRVSRTDGGKSESDKVQNSLRFERAYEIQEIALSYPNSCHAGVMFDAETLGGNIPTRAFELDGIKVKVPRNWVSPVKDEDGVITAWGYYDGEWDGTFKGAKEWSYDPAWILYDIITNERYGLGSFIDEINVDRFSFYDASQFNCQLVDDGIGDGTNPGGKEPRFTFNGVIQKRTDSIKTLQATAAVCRSVIDASGTSVRLIQDRPTEPTQLISNADVIGGEFTYVLADQKAKITQVDVSFNDKFDGYLSRTVTVGDFKNFDGIWSGADGGGETAVSRFGLNKKSKALPGVTSEGQAMREANWFLDTNLNGDRTINFDVGWRKAHLALGEVIMVSDDLFTDDKLSGLCGNGSTTTRVVFANPVELQAGQYNINIGGESSPINESNGTYSSVTLTLPLDDAPLPYETFILEGATSTSSGQIVEPQLYKVVALKENSAGSYSVSAAYYDEDKYTRVEEGIVVSPPLQAPIGGNTIAQPTIDRVIKDPYYIDEATNQIGYNLVVSWHPIEDEWLAGYKVVWQGDDGVWHDTGVINQTNFTVREATVGGDYQFIISAFNTRGIESPRTTTYFLGSDWGLDFTSLDPVTDLFVRGTGDVIFNTPDLVIDWLNPNPDFEDDAVIGIDGIRDKFKDYHIEIYGETDVVGVDDPTTVIQGHTLNYFTYTNNEINNDFGYAPRNIKIAVYCRDMNGTLSDPEVAIFNNPAPAIAANPQITPFSDNFMIVHDLPSEADARGTLIWVEPVVGNLTDFTPTASNITLNGIGKSHSVPVNQDDSDASPPTFMVKYAVYDSYSANPDELNISARVDVEMQARTGLAPAPGKPTGLAITSNTIIPPLMLEATVELSHTPVTGASVYDIQYTEVDTGKQTLFTSNNNITLTTLEAAQDYTVRVKSRNSDNVSSEWSDTLSFTTAVNDAPVPNVTTFDSIAGVGSVALSWTNPYPQADYNRTRIYKRTDNVAPTENDFLIAITGENYFDGGLLTGTQYYYYIKVENLSGNISDTYFPLSTGFIEPLASAIEIGPGAITSTHIADNAITTPKLIAGAVVAGKVAADQIIGNHIAAGAITSNEIAAGAITADMIQANSLAVGKAGQEIKDRISAIYVDNPGSGYETPPTVTISGTGTGASAEAFIRDGSVIGFSVSQPGQDYNTATVTLSAPTGDNPIQATATVETRDTGLVKVNDGAIQADHIAAGQIDASHIVSGSLVVGQANSNGTGTVTIQNGYVNADMVTTGELITDEAQIAQAVIEDLIVNNAIINDANIGTALINSALIDDQISSANYNPLTHTGWSITGTQGGQGFIESNNIAIYTSSGELVLAAGDDAVRRAYSSDTSDTSSYADSAANAENAANADNADNADALGGSPAANVLQDIADAQSTADGKVVVFYQDAQPSAAESSQGDIWFDTNDGNKQRVYNNSAWALAQDESIGDAINAAQDAQTTADGKAYVYYQTTSPGANASKGDIWVDTNDGYTTYVFADNNGTVKYLSTNDAQAAGVAAANAQSTANTATTKANTAQSTANTANTAASTAQSTANTANTAASTAQSTANTATTKANTAQSTANTAQSTASTAQSTANTAQSTANTANTAAGNAQDEAERAGMGSGTGGGNLIANGDMVAVDIYAKVAGVEPSYGATSNSTCGRAYQSDAIGDRVLDLYSSSDSSIGCVFPAVRVDQNAKYRVEIRAKSSGSYSSGFYSGVGYYTGDLPLGKTHVGLNTAVSAVTQAPSSSLTWPINNSAISTSWQTYSYEFTPPSNVKWMSVGILNWSGMSTSHAYIDQVRLSIIQPQNVNENNPITRGNSSVLIQDAAIQANLLSISNVTSVGNKTITTFDPLSDTPLTITDAVTDDILFDISLVDGKSQALVNGTAGTNFISNVQSLSEEVKYALSPFYNGLGAHNQIQNQPIDGSSYTGETFSFTMDQNGPDVSLKWKIYGREEFEAYYPEYNVDPLWRVTIRRNGTTILDKDYLGNGWAYDEYDEEDDTIPANSGNSINIDDGMVDSGATINSRYELQVRHQNGEMKWIELKSFEAETGSFLTPITQKSTNGYVVDQLSGMIIQWGYVSLGSNATKTINWPMAFPNACAQVTTNHKSSSTGNRDGWGAYSWTSTTGSFVNGMGSINGISYIAIGY